MLTEGDMRPRAGVCQPDPPTTRPSAHDPEPLFFCVKSDLCVDTPVEVCYNTTTKAMEAAVVGKNLEKKSLVFRKIYIYTR